MELIDFLHEHGPDELQRRFAIKAVRHQTYGNLVLLKYNQIDSPMGEKVVQQCRGIILDEADDWRIVSYPYDKFFNHGEGHAATIDWSTASVQEKLDGSLMTLYWYDGAWQVASSGTPDASGPVGLGSSMTMAELFWKTWHESGFVLPAETDRAFCFMFELMSPHNRVVVPWRHGRIVVHGVRNTQTLKEWQAHHFAHFYGWESVRLFPLLGIDAILAAAKTLNPMEREGYVVCDAKCRRIKVKSPQYVALAHMKDGFGPRRMVELVRANEGDEFLQYFPEYGDDYHAMKGAYNALVDELAADYAPIMHLDNQKDFALEAVKSRHSGTLFALRSGKASSVAESLGALPSAKLLNLLNIADREPIAP